MTGALAEEGAMKSGQSSDQKSKRHAHTHTHEHRHGDIVHSHPHTHVHTHDLKGTGGAAKPSEPGGAPAHDHSHESGDASLGSHDHEHRGGPAKRP
jgi:energy-coupling factor transport system ATP-binding protein